MHAVIDLDARRPVLPNFPAYGICILESRHGETFTMTESRYDFWEVMLVLDGKGWIAHGTTRHPLRAQDVIVLPKGAAYRLEDGKGSPLAVLCLCLKPSAATQDPWPDVLPGRFAVRRSRTVAGAVARHLRAILFEQSRPRDGTAARVVAESLLLLVTLRRKQPVEAAPRSWRTGDGEVRVRVQDHIRELDAAFHETESIQAVALRLGISSKSLTAHFRRLTGVTRNQYIRRLRIAHACRLLQGSGESVTSISFACGFEDLSTFFRAFRLEKKMSPNQWRTQP